MSKVHPNYDCGGSGHGPNASEVQWCHDCSGEDHAPPAAPLDAINRAIDEWYDEDHPGIDEDEWRHGLAATIAARLSDSKEPKRLSERTYIKGIDPDEDAYLMRQEEAAAEALAVQEADMCPNCVTPWKCNGPHEAAPPAAPLDVPEPITQNVGVFLYQHRMRTALAAFEEWARIVIPMLRSAGDVEAADFGEDRVAQSRAARLSDSKEPPRRQRPDV